ncbi:MAG: hypothetical protein KDC69_05500 [Flavobacteriaceae bacterium]|nr:hypothetical protein [Flavobacteriaceae bacterium]
MTDKEILLNNNTQDQKLYSARAITGATFLGGPIAAGYMIGENFKSLGKPLAGSISLIAGILFTILLFSVIFMIPERTIDQIPRQSIPLIYTAVIWVIVELKQGNILRLHKENGYAFYSGWRAAGIGLISLLILVAGIFIYVYFGMNDQATVKYQEEISQFSKNESNTLIFYNHLDTKTREELIRELEKITIPTWEKNLQIIDSTNKIKDLPSELLEQNKILLKYSTLRLQAFNLFKKALEEDTEEYFEQIDEIHQQINQQLDELNQ